MNKNVEHPAHYTAGDIEVIDYIRDKLSTDQFIGYCLGNVLKYVSRWQLKGGVEDLKKAQVYLCWAIGPEQKEEKPTIKHKPIEELATKDICDNCGVPFDKNHRGYFFQKEGKVKKMCYTCYRDLNKLP